MKYVPFLFSGVVLMLGLFSKKQQWAPAATAMASADIAVPQHISVSNTSSIALLTQNEWILEGYGYDINDNGKIDEQEESSNDCERDNTCVFFVNGSGLFSDNDLPCGNGISEHAFSWRLNKNETQLDMGFQTIAILRLNDHELVMYKNINRRNMPPLKHLTVFKRLHAWSAKMSSDEIF